MKGDTRRAVQRQAFSTWAADRPLHILHVFGHAPHGRYVFRTPDRLRQQTAPRRGSMQLSGPEHDGGQQREVSIDGWLRASAPSETCLAAKLSIVQVCKPARRREGKS